MGDQRDDEQRDDEQLDDLNIDEQPITDDTGQDSLPDPVLDEEPNATGDTPPVQEEEVFASAPPPSPSPQPQPYQPVYDGGFTPARDTPTSHAPPPPPQPQQPQIQFYTVEQLQRGVDEGLISQTQMFQQLSLQAKEQAKQEALQAFQAQQRTASLDSQLNEYRQLIPGWDQPGSPANQRAVPEYQRLLNLGLQNNDATRLLALENTFGTIQRIKEARQAQQRTAQLRPTPQQTGRKGPAPSSKKQKDPLDILSRDEKLEYHKAIKSGLYKDWNAVRAELRYTATELTTNPKLKAAHAGVLS